MPKGAGYSGPLATRALKVFDWWQGLRGPVIYSDSWAWGPEGRKESSVNHESQAWGIEAMRAAVARFMGKVQGPRAQVRLDDIWTRAKDVLMSTYFPRELESPGLWSHETLAGDNHTHQHLIGTMTVRAAAHISQDRQLLDLSGEVLRRTSGLLKLVATSKELWVCAPGLRAHDGKPKWFAGTAWLRELHGLPGPLPEFKRNPTANWRSGHGIPALLVRHLRKAGDDLGCADLVEMGPCKIKHRMIVARGPHRYVAALTPTDDIMGKRDVCSWVDVPDGAPSFKKLYERIGWEMDFAGTPPVIHDGRVWAAG